MAVKDRPVSAEAFAVILKTYCGKGAHLRAPDVRPGDGQGLIAGRGPLQP